MSRSFIIIAAIVLTASSLVGGYWSAYASKPKKTAAQNAKAALQNNGEAAGEPVIDAFEKAVALLNEKYVLPPDQEKVTRGAIVGMLHLLDPHSNFFNKREFAEMQDEQNSRFYGIGVTINQRNGKLYVLGVTRGMPAERAGLRYGDAIIAVDGKPANDWSQGDALKYVRGNRGTEVELTIERLGERAPLNVTVERDEVPYPSVRNHFMVKSDVGYIALTGGFNQATTDEMREALEALKKQGLKSLVLDLRRNTGGLLRQAIQVAEFFLPSEAEIVSVQGARASRQIYRSDNALPEALPLVILIDNETASASEIVAGAMQDQDRAWIVGEPSFGKGLVQTVFRMPSGTGLLLTTSKYYTASGRSIQREYNGLSFYDYYAEHRERDAASEEKAEKVAAENRAPTYLTPTRRVLRGGGGITPDKRVTAAEPDWHLRDACFEFARRLVAGTVPGLAEYKVAAVQHEYEITGNEFPITEAVIAAFREFLREQGDLRQQESKLATQLDYVRLRLRVELFTAAYGIETGERLLLAADPQVLTAISELPQARALQERARLIVPASKKN